MLLAPLPPCYTAALNLATPNHLRGTGIAFFAGTAGLLGLAGGPIIIAVFSDSLFGGDAIGLGMATTIGVLCPLGALSLATGCKAMRTAVMTLESSQAST